MNALVRIKHPEKYSISKFLIDHKELPFTRSEFESVLLNKSMRTVQSRLKELVESNILERNGSKGDEYKVIHSQELTNIIERPTFLNLPPDVQWPSNYEKELTEVEDILNNVQSLFISGDKASGKTSFVQALGINLSTKRMVCYYAFGSQGMYHFINLLINEIITKGITKNIESIQLEDENIDNTISYISNFIDQLFDIKNKPILILDNINTLGKQSEINSLITMLKFWKNITFIFVGNKMNNNYHFSDIKKMMEFNLNNLKTE
jgi:hypothetical protein